MDGSAERNGAAWLRCYRCWSSNLEVHVHYDGVHRIYTETDERAEEI